MSRHDLASSLVLVTLALSLAGCGDPMSAPDSAGALDGGGTRDAQGVDSGGNDASLADGAAAALDAGSPEPCSSPGVIEEVPCGMCGTASRFCTAGGIWEYGPCGGEGECAAGSTRMVPCGDCGERLARCDATCAWIDAGACTGEGECTPGETARGGAGCPAGQQRDLACSSECVFEPTSACAPDRCPTPGVIEVVPCGAMCGTQERFCSAANVWDYGACENEGACVPGTSTMSPCGMCGMQRLNCDTSCAYVPSGICMGEGACAPGARTRTSAGCPAGQTRVLECDASCTFTIVAETCRSTVPIDVLFLIDATASNFGQFQDQRDTFVTRCVDPLLAIPEVAVGLAYYGDFSALFGGRTATFVAGVELGLATSTAISDDVAMQSELGGGDDSTMEALHIVTGGTPQMGATPFVCSSGRTAGGCWRAGAERVVVLHTDEIARGGPDPASAGLFNPWPTGPSWPTVRPRLMADGTAVLVVLDDDYIVTGDPLGSYQEMATDLGQPATDVMIEAPDIDSACDGIVARVRTIAGI